MRVYCALEYNTVYVGKNLGRMQGKIKLASVICRCNSDDVVVVFNVVFLQPCDNVI